MRITITSLDNLPEAMQALVQKGDDGTMFIELPDGKGGPGPGGPNDDARLKEFRDNNIALKKQIEELQQKLGGIDMNLLEAGRKAMDAQKDEESKKLLQAGRFEDLMALQTQKLREEYDAKLKKVTDELTGEREGRTKDRESLRRAKIATDLQDAAAALKVRIPGPALPDVYSRAYEQLNLDDHGNVVGFDSEGNLRMTEDRKTYDSRAFIKELFESAPHLIEGANVPAHGGGPRRGAGGALTLDVDASDPTSFGQNLESIAKGKVNVRQT